MIFIIQLFNSCKLAIGKKVATKRKKKMKSGPTARVMAKSGVWSKNVARNGEGDFHFL